jgi:hypothetical protein
MGHFCNGQRKKASFHPCHKRYSKYVKRPRSNVGVVHKNSKHNVGKARYVRVIWFNFHGLQLLSIRLTQQRLMLH